MEIEDKFIVCSYEHQKGLKYYYIQTLLIWHWGDWTDATLSRT